MAVLDMGTVLACYSLSTLVCAAAVGIRWHQFRDRYRGMGFWFADFLLQCLGFLLLMARPSLPAVFSVSLANAAIVLGFVLLLRGFLEFFGIKRRQIPEWTVFAVFLLAHAWFTFVRPGLRSREIVFSLAMILFCATAFRDLARIERRFPVPTRFALAAFIAFACLSGLRIGAALLSPAKSGLLDATAADAWIMAGNLCAFIALTFVIQGMPGRRVLEEERERIKEKEALATAYEESEEIRSRAFQASPDAICIARLGDGSFIEVNQSFCEVFGYARREALSARFPDLLLDKGAMAGIVQEALGIGQARDLDLSFLRKTGEGFRSSLSGSIIEIKGEKHLLAIIGGAKEADRTETVLRARLKLWDFSFGRSVEELMTKALDEIEAMTGSSIGFYHLVDEEAGTLSLQAWSTSTTESFCRADARGLHYPIEKAGVWADAIRSRKAIIHNDYASLPGKKGMPEGHAELKRELVAPTFRDGRIVAILGVGNKPGDYSEADVSLVSYVADLIWTIVAQRRAEERIRDLNARLEELAMKDELTGMANRRSFYAQAARELQKSKRYSTGVAFIMLDIDHFKDINDENGHDAGDAALVKVASTIRAGVRDADVAARLGGEEFGILMPFADSRSAKAVAERIRLAVEASREELKGRRIELTISAGVAADATGQAGLEELMHRADVALYRAKHKGRNRTELE